MLGKKRKPNEKDIVSKFKKDEDYDADDREMEIIQQSEQKSVQQKEDDELAKEDKKMQKAAAQAHAQLNEVQELLE